MIPKFDWFNEWANYCPNKIAFEEYESKRTLTFLEINNLANYLSNFFINELNFQKNDRIAVLAENQLEYILLFAVAQKTGIILVLLSGILSNELKEYFPDFISLFNKNLPQEAFIF